MEVSFGGSVLFVLMGVRDDVCVCPEGEVKAWHEVG